MKKRILFVESNPLLLQAYGSLLDSERDRWDVQTAADGPQALELVDHWAFDVVVADLHIEGPGGIEFLAQVKSKHPQSTRIILSEYSNQEEFSKGLDASHLFLPKPLEAATLKATLARIAGLDAYLSNPNLKTIVGQLGTLPSLPSLYIEIMKEISQPEPSSSNVAGIVSRDPGMTAKLLQIANSAVIGLSQKVSSPAEAVQYLGMGTVRALALSAPLFSCFEPASLQGFFSSQLWDHALRSAQIAAIIARVEGAGMADAEDAYTAAMLHDVGKLMLACSVPDEFLQALTLATERRIPLFEAEVEMYGATHAAVAAYLLGLWGLPAAIVEAVAFHHTPKQSDLRAFGPLAAVHAANVLDHGLIEAQPCGRAPVLDIEYLAGIGCQNRVEIWRAEATRLLGTQPAA